MFGGLETLIGAVCGALCCLLFVVLVVGIAVTLLRKKGGDDEPAQVERAPAAPAAAPAPARPARGSSAADAPTERMPPEQARELARTEKIGTGPADPTEESDLPSTRKVDLDAPRGAPLGVASSATIIPPDDWIDDDEDDATTLMSRNDEY